MSRTLLLITGAGRSGTSTAAGTLFHLGVHVPGPYLEANESNPRGFYESRWSVEFHNRLLKRANVTIADGRPEARDHFREAVRETDRTRLADWLEEATAGHELSLVKDPRTTWSLDLWSETCAELGMSLGFLVMLRHPAEVLGSRATHYGARNQTMTAAEFAAKNLAGWVNAMLMTELQTRGRRRSFLRYEDLLADWRSATATMSKDLGVDLGEDLASTQPHPVDEFIDPGLSRHRLTWSDLEVLPDLAELATGVWRACEQIADAGGTDPEAEERLDAARERYSEMYLAARQLTVDHTQAEVNRARQQVRRELARRHPQSPGSNGGRPGRRWVSGTSYRARARRAARKVRAFSRR
jgi:hypothetical protein